MDTGIGVVVLVAVVAVLGALTRGRAFPVPLPLLLVGVGVAGSFVPGVPVVHLDPDLVLDGLLPPLLYSAALATSLLDLRKNRTALGLLSVVLVIVSTSVVGFVTWAVLPGVGLAAAFALGAVVAPPDAVAASAIARRVGLPRKITSILEGESLVNDATALVALNTAVAAITAAVTPQRVALDFVLAAGGGVVVGLVVANVLSLARKRIDDPVVDTSLSYLAPYLAFLPAQAVGASGVLAVVVTGLVLGQRSPVLQSGASRIAERMNWATVEFLLENVVFLLIGLQVRPLLSDLGDTSPGRAVAVCAAVVGATIGVRLVWMLGIAFVFRHGTTAMRTSAWGYRGSVVVGWAGMRGVVTLAAAFILPEDTPHRQVLVLAALAVVAGTLVIQGGTLPALVRRMGLPAPSPAEDALQAASLLSEAASAGIVRLDAEVTDADAPEIVAQLRDRATHRSNIAWERLGRSQVEVETPSATYRRLRLLMLLEERATVVAARDAGTADDEVLRQVMRAIDTEESLLDRLDDADRRVTGDLVTPQRRAGDCEHLRDAPTVVQPRTPKGCEECLRDGTRWVHLRMCLTCGHIGCCDSSVGKHADGHFAEIGHPVMRSFEPGEAWRWCYVDSFLG